MPEYVLNVPPETAEPWQALDPFTQGFITAAFWLLSEDEALPDDVGFHLLAPEALAEIKDECAQFQELAAADLAAVYAIRESYTAIGAGIDFYLTRNGHGAGFWDRGFGDLRTDTPGGRLSRDAKSFGGFDLILGDDGLLHAG